MPPLNYISHSHRSRYNQPDYWLLKLAIEPSPGLERNATDQYLITTMFYWYDIPTAYYPSGITKISNDGTVIFSVELTGPVVADSFTYFQSQPKIRESTGEIYALGRYTISGNMTSSSIYTVKLSSTGNIIWQRKIDWPTSNTFPVGLIGVSESTGNAYFFHTVAFNNYLGFYQNNGLVIGGYSNNGSLLWNKKIYSTTLSIENTTTTIDSAGDILITSAIDDRTNANFYITVLKYSSSGNKLWQYSYDTTGQQSDVEIITDNSNNVYVIYSRNNGTTMVPHILKMNSSGILQWVKEISNPLYQYQETNIYIVSDGTNVYISCLWGNGGGINGVDSTITKIDSNGAVVWARSFDKGVDNTLYVLDCTTSALHLNAYNEVGADVHVKYPTDGSIVGTYDGLTISNSSINLLNIPVGEANEVILTLFEDVLVLSESAGDLTLTNKTYTHDGMIPLV